MPVTYHLTPDAQSDLIGIHRFTLAQWGTTQSKTYLSGLRQTIQLLAETPSLGKNRPEVRMNVFSFPYSSHVIYYIQHEHQFVVFGILHKSMVPLAHLAEREII
ncbi:plasmid stabilization protein [Shewanella sp. Pdp11]|uniref:type II toxin-antitoxin system RelE/ParE family toxin n=1 Tax=Shewanella sp. Pdp11 TaxID=2059264 RepID=UPI000CA35CCA|nr:type II toxin-antitoxin system RelE/ParE family toxin [Shewanella sp. Pdp11]AUD60511.1 plasmid stabilization protein [Shewanella sp. Pdp11]